MASHEDYPQAHGSDEPPGGPPANSAGLLGSAVPDASATAAGSAIDPPRGVRVSRPAETAAAESDPPGGSAVSPSRRRFLAGAAGTALSVPLLGFGHPQQGRGGSGSVGRGRTGGQPRLPDGLFALGVASGDPLPNGVVLWTRLAPAPLEGGGMPALPVPVRWEIAHDEEFRRIARRGVALASPRWAHSVHVDVRGLRPDRWYHYRFIVGDQVSPVGRTRTAPPPGRGDTLRFLFASCQNFRNGFWPAWAHAPNDDPDLLVFLGDYIYEADFGTAVREHNGPETQTLEDYRSRYGLYKGDPALQAIHATCPWVVTWDDHEVDDNYAGLVPQVPSEAAAFAARRAAAYQAWWEHQPVRTGPPRGPNLRIFRSLDWGRLARFHILDVRQHRSVQPCRNSEGDISLDLGGSCLERLAPERTMLGPEQERWLGRNLRRSHATWDVIASTVVLTSMPLAGAIFNRDQWDGYPAARTRLLDQIRAARVANALALSGDVHAFGVGELVDEGPDASPVATELVSGSISSEFPEELVDVAEELIGALPHVRHVVARRRGYVRCDLDREQLVARLQVAESVLTPDAPVATESTWTVTAGTPGAEPSGSLAAAAP